MRLSKLEINKIITAIESELIIKNASLFLYGSRVKDNLKGGDIDLLLIFNNIHDTVLADRKKYDILLKIKSEIGDQKIDLSFSTKELVSADSFLSMIFDECKLIKKWNSMIE